MIKWAQKHKDDPPPPDDDENKEKRTDDIDPWDQEFLKVDQGTLFELILVSINRTVSASLSLTFWEPTFLIWSLEMKYRKPKKKNNYSYVFIPVSPFLQLKSTVFFYLLQPEPLSWPPQLQ